MTKVIAIMALVVTAATSAAYKLYQYVPQPIPTAVIGEKQEKTLGGSAAVLLPENLNNKQAVLLNSAYAIAKSEGFKNPEIVQSILLQETRAGGMKSYNVANAGPDAYYGPMQIKLAATRDVLARDPSLYTKYDFHTHTDDEVKANLILNHDFNIRVAVRYLGILQKTYGLSGANLVNAYQAGPGGLSTSDGSYARGAAEKLAAYKHRT